MEDFSSENCQKAFSEMRSKMQRAIAKALPEQKEEVAIDCYNDICLRASKNDCIAQDYLSYIFKKGLYNVVPINYEKFMQWQILAAANGNQFTIDKLSLFLNFPLSEIMLVEDFEYICSRNNLTQENYDYVVGRLICEAIADELMLDTEKLLKEPLDHIDFNEKTMRVFDRARNFIIPKIVKFLRN